MSIRIFDTACVQRRAENFLGFLVSEKDFSRNKSGEVLPVCNCHDTCKVLQYDGLC